MPLKGRETDQLYVAKSATSRSDVEVQVVGSATERKLRIFSMAGDCILERTAQELRPYHRVSDLIQILCQTTGHKPCRLVLLDGRVRLQPSDGFKGLWPPLNDLELQVIVVPGPSLDLGRELTLKCAEFLEVYREGPSKLSVRFQRGQLLEQIQESVILHHRVTLTTPHCFGEIHSTSAAIEQPDQPTSEAVIQLQLEAFLNHSLATGFRELKMQYGRLDLDFWIQGEFHSHLGGCKRTQACKAADGRRLLQSMLALFLHWFSDLFSMICGIWLAVVMTAEGVQQLVPLLVTLWLPGLAWSLRFQFFSGGRNCRGLFGSGFSIFHWLFGIIWIWQPAGLIIASLVLPAYFSYKLIRLLGHLWGYVRPEPPFPLNPDIFALYELYMRDARCLGDAPRTILLLSMFLFPDAQLPQEKLQAALISSILALLMAGLPHRTRMRRESWTYFDSVIMAVESEEDEFEDPS